MSKNFFLILKYLIIFQTAGCHSSPFMSFPIVIGTIPIGESDVPCTDATINAIQAGPVVINNIIHADSGPMMQPYGEYNNRAPYNEVGFSMMPPYNNGFNPNPMGPMMHGSYGDEFNRNMPFNEAGVPMMQPYNNGFNNQNPMGPGPMMHPYGNEFNKSIPYNEAGFQMMPPYNTDNNNPNSVNTPPFNVTSTAPNEKDEASVPLIQPSEPSAPAEQDCKSNSIKFISLIMNKYPFSSATQIR